jgi:hypothetical protein
MASLLSPSQAGERCTDGQPEPPQSESRLPATRTLFPDSLLVSSGLPLVRYTGMLQTRRRLQRLGLHAAEAAATPLVTVSV